MIETNEIFKFASRKSLSSTNEKNHMNGTKY